MPAGSGSGSEPESGPTSDAGPPSHSRQKAESKAKLKPESVSGDDDVESVLDFGPDSDSDKPSGGRELRLSFLRFRSVVSPEPEARIRKMS